MTRSIIHGRRSTDGEARTLASLLLALVMTSIACSPSGTAPGSRRSECSRLIAPTEDTEPSEPRIVIFGHPESQVVEFFQSHRLAVAMVSDPRPDAEGGVSITLHYPSFNSDGGSTGSTVMYSHVGSLVEIGPTTELVDLERLALVLEAKGAGELHYEWVGCVTPDAGPHLDWFAGKPELLFRNTGGS